MNLITLQRINAIDLIKYERFPQCGAIVTFEGVVRNHHQGRSVAWLYYEAYGSMSEKILHGLIEEIQAEWPQCVVRARHRIGTIEIGEVAVAIAVWAPHRHEAFQACEAMIDRIKQRVPIWKKETYQDGKTNWVKCDFHDHA